MARNDALASAGAGLKTPQSQAIPGREKDMSRNAAGGVTFDKNLWTKVEDFLILGITDGTYYVSRDNLATANIAWLEEAAAAGSLQLATMVRDIATERPSRAMKPRPYLFALAMAYARGDAVTKAYVRDHFGEIVRTTDHLAMFFGYYKNLRGIPGRDGKGTKFVSGRGLRTALSSWFQGDLDQVATTALKGRQRKTPQGEDMELRDIIRLAHPAGATDGHKALIRWLAGRDPENASRAAVSVLHLFLQAQDLKTEREAVTLITAHEKMPWEFIPSALRKREVWQVLAPRVGMTALLRNLALMTRLDAITPLSETTRQVCARLTDQQALIRARIHPADIWLALRVYQSGRSQPNPKADVQRWEPVPAILAALSEAFELSFGTVQPSGRKLLVAVDSSGSMTMRVTASGSDLGSAFQCGLAMATILNRIEGDNVHVVCADTRVHPSQITRHTRLGDLPRMPHPGGGGTDLAAVYNWAERERIEADGFVILSDMETWAGWQHPAQAYASYMRTMNRHARNVAVAMCATHGTIADPRDPNTLQVAGLDAALPRLITGFIR